MAEERCKWCKAVGPTHDPGEIFCLGIPSSTSKKRVKVFFTEGFENYPFVNIEKYETGDIVSADDHEIWVSMHRDFKYYDALMWEKSGWPVRGVCIDKAYLETVPDLLEVWW
jgi:hypothetical protein